jgi:hypothetical protein
MNQLERRVVMLAMFFASPHSVVLALRCSRYVPYWHYISWSSVLTAYLADVLHAAGGSAVTSC